MDTEASSAPQNTAPIELTEQQSAQIMARYRLEQQVLSGANNFFWIAGLSLINSILYLMNVNWSFFIGLGITQLIDAIASNLAIEAGRSGAILRVAGLGVDVFLIGMLVFFGVFARKRHLWAFVIGMLVYALDGILLLLIGEFVGVALHVLFLFLIFRGTQALRQLEKLGQSGVITNATATTTRRRSAPKWFWIFLIVPLGLIASTLCLVAYVLSYK